MEGDSVNNHVNYFFSLPIRNLVDNCCNNNYFYLFIFRKKLFVTFLNGASGWLWLRRSGKSSPNRKAGDSIPGLTRLHVKQDTRTLSCSRCVRQSVNVG